jgi:hypothetical protein
MPDVKLPLSGDVTQTLFPWTNALTINLGQSADPAVERDALSVASYGRQLGRIGDALIVLLRHLPQTHELPEDERRAIRDLTTMLHELANVKDRHGARHVLRPG